MRLVDADAIFSNELLLVRAECYDAVHAVIEKINNAPTVDAIEVVRCKDCRWRNGLRCYHKRSSMNDLVGDNDFCSWGERGKDGKTG